MKYLITSEHELDKMSFCNDDIIEFDSAISVNNIKLVIDKIEQYEVTKDISLMLNTKKLQIDTKQKLLELYLTTEKYVNSTIVLNIINLIKSHTALHDEYFNYEYTIFNDITELLNIKLNLKNEILNFSTTLIKYYLGIFKSLHKVESNGIELFVTIPKIYQLCLENFDYIALSTIFAKCNNINTDTIPYVANAYQIFSSQNEKFSIYQLLLDKVMPELENNLLLQ